MRVLSVLCAAVLFCAPALGQATWTGASSTSWFDAGNWSTGALPDELVDVTVPVTANGPDVPSGVATVKNLDVLEGAVVSVSGTGSLEVKGDLTLVSSVAGTGVLALGTSTSSATVFGAWNQADKAAVTSAGGEVLFTGGSTIAGAGAAIPYVQLATGTVTLLADVEFGHMTATGGTSAGSFDWVVVAPDATLAVGAQPVHSLRIDAGKLSVSTSEVTDLTLSGGELFIEASNDLFVSNLVDLQTGQVSFGNLGSSSFRVGKDLIAAQAVTWGSGYVDMDGTATTISGPLAGTAYLNRLRFKTGTCDLLAPVEIASWVGSAGGTVTGDWLELVAPSGFMSSGGGPLHRVRLKSGLTNVFSSGVDELEVLGGKLVIVGNQTLTVHTSADFQLGEVAWNNKDTSKIQVAGALVSGPGMTWGDGFIEMDGTTTIDGPGGTSARVGKLRLLSGTCTLLHPVKIDLELNAGGGDSTGDWFELVGTSSVLSQSSGLGGGPHQVRMVSGSCMAETATIGALEVTGGILEVPSGKVLTVSGNAELLAGQLQFSGSLASALDVLGDVHQVATGAAVTMSAIGALRCGGVWTADAAIDLGASFVEFSDGSSITGAAPVFENLRLRSGATVSLLNIVEVTGRLENDGGTSQGLWFECKGLSPVLATGSNAVHEVRITGGVTTAEDASVDVLKLEGGELAVAASDTLTVGTSLELTAGTLSLDPTDSGVDARIEVAGNVTMLGTTAAALTGSGGSVRCDGLWFGNGPADFGASFVEFGAGSTVLGSAVSFGRVRFADGAASLNTLVPVTKEIVVAEGATVAGFFPLNAAPGIGNVCALSGTGTLAELHVIDGTVEAAGGNVTQLRIPGGSFVATGNVTAGAVFLEGGSLVAREGGTLDVAGALELTSGTLDFEVDPAGATGLEARVVADSVHQVAAVGGAGLAEGVLGCRGAFVGDGALDLGLGRLEVGDAVLAGSIGGSAVALGNVRIVNGAVALLGPVPVAGRLGNVGGSSSGDWFELGGVSSELVTGTDALHAVRVTAGQTRALPSVVDALEVAGGELLVDASGTLTVTSNLELLGGTLAFDAGGGTTLARLEVPGDAHQVGTLAGSVTSAGTALAVGGTLTVDAPFNLGSSFVELMSGARLVGSVLAVDSLRVRKAGLAGALPGQPATVEAAGGVTTALEVEAGATLEIKSGGLAVLPASVSIDGAIEVDAGAFLALSPATTMTVQTGGRLGLLGDATSPAVASGYLGGGYSLIVNGEFGARNFVVADMGLARLTGSASVGAEGLHAGLFDRGVGPAGGALFEMLMPGSFDFVGLDFVGGAGDSNVRRAAGAGVGEVTLHAFGGALGGAAFEDDPSQGAGDPNGLLVWENLALADLKPLDVTSDVEGVFGWPLNVDFSVVNQGANLAAGPWTDRLVLTPNMVLGDGDDVILAEFAHAADEPGGGLYPISAAPLLPSAPLVSEGTYWLALVSDVNDDVAEPGFETNNTLFSAPFELFATPRPNLVAFSIDGPMAADDGTDVEVTWTVENAGLGATDELTGAGGTWEDRVYLSADAVYGGDFLLGTYPITAGDLPGGIAPGGSYTETQTVALPKGIAGSFYLIARSDAVDEVTPESQEDDNVVVGVTALVVTQPDLPDLVGSFQTVTSPLGALYTDTSVTVDWAVTNNDADANGLGSANGMWRERFWLSFDPFVDPLIDTLVFEVQHEGLVEPLGTYGGSHEIQLPSQAGTWFLLGEADALGDVNEGDEANNVWFQALSVLAPAWTGSVTTTFTEGLASTGPGSQQITLTGSSTKIGSVQLEANAALTVRVRQGSSRRVFDVTTDAIGAYTLVFEPLVGEAGVFDVFCDHPAVDEDPLLPEVSFTLHGLDVAPLAYSASLATGEVRAVSFGISNMGSVALANLGMVGVGLPAHLAMQNLVAPTSLNAGASDVVSFDLVALGDAPDPPGPSVPANFSFDFSFDLAGAPVVAKSVPASVWVTPFTPDLKAVGLASTAQVAIDGATQIAFQIRNEGGAPVTGASLSIDDPASLGLGCVFGAPFSLSVPASLGDIGPGESRLVAFTVVPSACADLGVGTTLAPFTTTVTANEGVFQFGVNLQILAVAQTTLVVSVQDAASWWNANGAPLGGAGPGLSGANVTITDALGASQSAATDSAGNILFSGLEGGLFKVVIDPPVIDDGHLAWTSSVQVAAGQTTSIKAYLPTLPLTYEVVGTKDATTGVVDFALQTSASGVPEAAVLEISGDGALLDLDLAVGETAQFDLVVTNTGGATVEDLELFTSDLDDYLVTPHMAYLGSLDKDASVPVVISVTRTGLGDPCNLAGANFGLRHFVTADEPVWFWTPVFVVSADSSAGCASAIAGGAPPLALPPPLAPPPFGPPAFVAAPYLGSAFASGADPLAPLRAALPTITLTL